MATITVDETNKGKRIPDAVKRLRGNPGQKRIRPEIKLRRGRLPAPPRSMQGEARNEWLRISDELYHLGLLTGADLKAFTNYCYACEAEAEANEACRGKNGRIIFTIFTANGNEQVNPRYTAWRSACADVNKYASEFGLTPVARSRIVVSETQIEDEVTELTTVATAA